MHINIKYIKEGKEVSEYIFGPSSDWLVEYKIKNGESFQPRLDGGYDGRPYRSFGDFAIRTVSLPPRLDPDQLVLFDSGAEKVDESN